MTGSSRLLIFLGIGIVLFAAVVFFLARPAREAPGERAVRLELAEGRLDPGEVSVPRGSVVRVEIRAAEEGELHLHEYAVARHLVAGGVDRFDLVVDRPGRFVWELHRAGAAGKPAGVLMVLP